MGQTFTKIKYVTEGSWGSDKEEHLYLHWNRTGDTYTLYDNDMKPLIHFDSWGYKGDDFTSRLIELLTHQPAEDNNVEYCTNEEEKILKENMFK